MTEKELLDHLKNSFEVIDQKLARLTTGNFAHSVANMRSLAQNNADIIKNYLKQKDE